MDGLERREVVGRKSGRVYVAGRMGHQVVGQLVEDGCHVVDEHGAVGQVPVVGADDVRELQLAHIDEDLGELLAP
ncbi:hypothetical protein [Actinomadura sp. 6N118]|uniref:hypothetical protein n=1 Tax=Actinomadura sp. 6N118 TaxID=3375151 RepID=UPI0037B0074F